MVQVKNSNYISWQVIRKNSAFLKRQRGIDKLFSTEPCNPMSVNSFRYNGFVNKTAVGVQSNRSGKGVVLTMKTNKSSPAKSTNSITLTDDAPHNLKSIKRIMTGYKPAHTKIVQRRAAKLLQAQKPKKARKQKGE